jgi:hypothetical protein
MMPSMTRISLIPTDNEMLNIFLVHIEPVQLAREQQAHED